MFKKARVKKCVALLGLFICLVILPLVYPQSLFAYKVNMGNLSVYSDQAIPQSEAEAFLGQIKHRLDNSPFQVGALRMQIYIANTAWRRSWLWLIPPNTAGGFVVVPLTGHHAFFSGADFKTNELIAPSGYRTQPPRTLVYYGAHELTHVATAAKVGWTNFYRTPVWVKEGIADYVALPSETAAELYLKIGEREADLEMMKTHGVYAPYRLLVTYFLEESGWTIDQLLDCRLTFEEAQAIVFESLREQQ